MNVASSLYRFAACTFLAASCAAYRFEEQHLYLRHSAEADEVAVVVFSEGLHAEDDKGVGKVADLLTKMLAGHRFVLIYDWPLQFDIDKFVAEEEEDELAKRFQAWIDGVSMTRAELYRNEESRPCLFQQLLLPKTSALLAIIDEAINRSLMCASANEELPLSWPDPETWKLWREHAQSGGRWSTFEDGTFLFSVPCTERSAGRALSTLLTRDEKDINFVRSLVAAATSVRVADGQAELRFQPDQQGWIHLRLPRSDWEYDPALDRELQARDSQLPTRNYPGPPR